LLYQIGSILNVFVPEKGGGLIRLRKRWKFGPSFPKCCPQVVIELMVVMVVMEVL
jgi:hypothetical protein